MKNIDYYVVIAMALCVIFGAVVGHQYGISRPHYCAKVPWCVEGINETLCQETCAILLEARQAVCEREYGLLVLNITEMCSNQLVDLGDYCKDAINTTRELCNCTEDSLHKAGSTR